MIAGSVRLRYAGEMVYLALMSSPDLRYHVARAFASDRGLVLKSNRDTDEYALVDAESMQPVLGNESDGYLVSLEEVEAFLGIEPAEHESPRADRE